MFFAIIGIVTEILIVDDERVLREAWKATLLGEGFAVRTAKDGDDALVKIDEKRPDLVLLDVMMPVIDGLEATKIIRSLCRSDAASIPIISMTANAFEEDVQKSLAAGMNEHLSKPINGKLLVSTLMKYKKT